MPRKNQIPYPVFQLGHYKEIIKEYETTKMAGNAAPVISRAYSAVGDQAKGEKVLLDAIKENRSVSLLVEYADLLVGTGQDAKAAKVYRDLLSKDKATLEKNKLGSAVILNNLAWTTMQMPDYNAKFVINAAEKAYQLAPEHIQILDTYATALSKSNKQKEVISLLEPNKFLEGEPKLLFLLASAYEKAKDVNKAVRTYKLCAEGIGKDSKLNFEMSKKTVEQIADDLAGGFR